MAVSDPRIGDIQHLTRARQAAVFALVAFAASSAALMVCGLWRLVAGVESAGGLATTIALLSPPIIALAATAACAGRSGKGAFRKDDRLRWRRRTFGEEVLAPPLMYGTDAPARTGDP